MSARQPAPPSTRLSTLTLLGLVLLGFVAIIGFSSMFQSLIGKLDRQLDNERARLFVGEQIIDSIGKLERLFLQLPQTSHKAMHQQIGRDIEKTNKDLSSYLEVLQYGGNARRQLPLNLPGADEMLREVSYQPDPGVQAPPMEVIELSPYLDRLQEKHENIHQLLHERERCLAQRLPCQAVSVEAVNLFYKTLASFFYRLNENANRQFYNSAQSLDRLELRMHQEESKLLATQLTLICAIAGLVLGLSILFTRRINLTMSQLEFARRQADAASAAKSRFLASMSHEIRTPMNAILGMAQVLEKGQVGAQQQHQCASLILDSGRELLGLLNEILDLAKVESGQMLLHPSIVSPVRVARDAMETYRELAESQGLTLSMRSTLPESRRCLLDAARFKQILGNLLSNAIKFTPTGSISIEIDELEPEGPGARLEVAVRDTGIGIPGDQIGQLFEKFWQVDNSLTRRHTGSGLGLSIVRQLAELMGGQAGVSSTLGAGSRFWVQLTLPPAAPPEQALEDTGAPPQAITDRRLTGHVLVAEDMAGNVATITAMLSVLGVSSEVVSDGRQVIDALGSGHRFDCILMDINMPVMDGIEATRAIRRLEAEAPAGTALRCPILGVTANAYVENQERCLAAGMDGFIAKPVTFATLRAELARHLPAAAVIEAAPAAMVAAAALPTLPDPGRMHALLGELQPLLADHRFEAMDKYGELCSLLHGSRLQGGLRPVGEQLQRLDFKAASALLQQWRTQHALER